MYDSPFVKSCKKMVTENNGSMIFPGTDHTVSSGSWKIVQLIAKGKSLNEVEKLVGKTWPNIARHIKGQRYSDIMEDSLLAATSKEEIVDKESSNESTANESNVKVGDKNKLAERLYGTSSALLDFLKVSTVSDREYLRSLLSSKTKQDLRLSVQALMSEENFHRITKEGGLK